MRYFLLFICLFPFYLNAQSFIDFEYKNNKTTCDCNDTPAQNILDTLDNIKKNKRFLACCYHCIGIYYYYDVQDDLEAIKYYKKSLEIRKKYQGDLLWKSYRNIAYTYYEVGYYERAIEAIYRGFEINDSFREDAPAYKRLGRCYVELGEFEKAITALERAVKLADSNYELAEANNSLCFTLIETKDSLNLIRSLKHADEAIKLFENEIGDMASAYGNKGNAYGELNQHKDAIQAHNKAREIYVEEKDTVNLARTLNNIAATLYEQGKHHEAIEKLKLSLELKKKYFWDDNYQYTYAANHENLAENYEALGNIDKALQHYQLALQNLTNNFRNQDINTNPKVKEDYYTYNKPDLLRVLDLKAQAALKIDNINLAHATYQVLDEWITEFYKDLSTNQSKLIWIARAHNIYTHAIDIALKKGDKEKAFQYAEKARAVLLWQSHSRQAALNLLSQEDREKQEDILAQIRQADQQYRDGDIDIAELRSIENKQNNLEKYFEEKYPDYAKRKYQPKTITVADVQNNILNDSTALIEYHWSDDKLYIFTLTRNDIFINTSNIDADFHQHIDRFNTTLKSSSSDLTDLTTSGYSIYQKTLTAALNHLNDNIKKLTLLPDGKLNYIAFEALPTQKVNKLFNIPYLIDDYTINYLYSCNTYGEITAKEHTHNFLGIAPSYEKTEGLDNLDHNKAEVQAINKMYGGKVLLGTQATREALTQDTSNIVHIASHATQGKGDGKIYLYGNDVLTQKDIQAHTWNHVQQVILSACETGTGELSKGEGVLSLGWSFVYRGVPSVVMSQWKVDDVSTKKLMLDYHKKLQEKIPADEALRQAKLDFRNNGNDAKKHPYYWAAFIHTGNPPTGQSKASGTKTWYLIPAFLLIAIVTFLYRRNSQS